ncbi:MAG TPA: hypothetical protein G4N98_05315 [Thermoflexia bacterium]|nr:hypothetical protein [Thermoflexia bacterium]
MNTQISLLQAEIQADIDDIEQAYLTLAAASERIAEPEMDVVVGYYLQVIYGLFENLFKRIAVTFGEQITDPVHWHARLLRRMTLAVPEMRISVIDKETYRCLDELRRFRHLFHNAYILNFDRARLRIVLEEAQKLKQLYVPNLERFLEFLDTLVDVKD